MHICDEHGNMVDIEQVEKQEQDLAREYIEENDVVLELGARYGSVSCIINSKLSCKTNQVSVEPDDRVWDPLEKNRAANNCNFHILKGFLSKKNHALTALDNWYGYGTTSFESTNSTIPSTTLEQVKSKYGLKFNVLVADCEGFLETFFEENPEVYDELRLIIFEIDYPEKCNYNLIMENLYKRGFTQMVWGHQNVWVKR
jgi:FkbM family methyltransferase